MVYLDEVIKNLKKQILEDNESLHVICYFYLTDKSSLPKNIFENTGDEESLAIKGYLGIKPDVDEVKLIVGRKPIKQIDYTSNIFKLLGISLAAPTEASKKLNEKFDSSSINYKYLIARVFPEYKNAFVKYLEFTRDTENIYCTIFNFLFELNTELDIQTAVSNLALQNLDIIDLLILEELRAKFISQEFLIAYNNLTAIDLVRQVLSNFGNSVKKITQNRRKGHESFSIKDEYDVQDLLYVMLKPIFPKMIDEEPTPQVGPKFNKIDLLVKEEGIMIEVKMIKDSDRDEKEFVEQLKIDIQSYYRYAELKHLFMYIYDPQNKTRDLENFLTLNGEQTIQGKKFYIEILVGN